MKLLANENFPRVAVEALRQHGHDVVWARIDMPGDDDESILPRAQAEDRLILTFDKDFGELAFRFGLPAESGIILLRFAADQPDEKRRPTHTFKYAQRPPAFRCGFRPAGCRG